MASGHVNRTQRPNTWLLRPDCDVQKSPCQRGAVHTWHKAELFGTSTEFCQLPEVLQTRSAGAGDAKR